LPTRPDPIHSTGPMLRRALRCALFAIVTVAIWTLSRPAFAMPAPLCDDRGATSLAPPPTLLAPELAVLRAAPPLPCEDADLAAGPTVAPSGHGQQMVSSSQGDPAVVTGAAPLASPAGEPLALPPPDAPSTEGVQYRIERPPRG
jgi:hypothetical protein